MTIKEIEMKASQIKELQRLIEEATAEADSLKDEIKNYMTENEAEILEAGMFRITWKSVSSSRVDAKALKGDCPEIFERYSKTTISKRFLIA